MEQRSQKLVQRIKNQKLVINQNHVSWKFIVGQSAMSTNSQSELPIVLRIQEKRTQPQYQIQNLSEATFSQETNQAQGKLGGTPPTKDIEKQMLQTRALEAFKRSRDTENQKELTKEKELYELKNGKQELLNNRYIILFITFFLFIMANYPLVCSL